MPFIASEDVGTTPRRSLSARRRLQAWERTKGVCVICEAPIDGVRDRWIVEHIRALELGGLDDLTNMGPAHEACGRAKTRDDHARTARAKRQKALHLGASVTLSPMPGSRSSPLKRKLNGRVILREEPQCKPGAAVPPVSEVPPRFMGESAHRRTVQACSARQQSGMVNEDGTDGPTVQKTVSKEATDSHSQCNSTKPNGASSRGVTAAARPGASFLPTSHVILTGEEEAQYEKLRSEITRAVGPTDIIEELWVRDVSDLVWEVLRLRRLRGALLQVAVRAGLMKVLERFLDYAYARELTDEWCDGLRRAKKEVDRILTRAGLSFDVVTAEALAARLDDFERVDRLIASAEARRNAVLREVHRHRDALAARLARAGEAIIEAEFSDVAPDDLRPNSLPVHAPPDAERA
jgi:hypothetical protein